MGNAYQSRLDRIEAEVVKRHGGNVILVFAADGDDDKAIAQDCRAAAETRPAGE